MFDSITPLVSTIGVSSGKWRQKMVSATFVVLYTKDSSKPIFSMETLEVILYTQLSYMLTHTEVKSDTPDLLLLPYTFTGFNMSSRCTLCLYTNSTKELWSTCQVYTGNSWMVMMCLWFLSSAKRMTDNLCRWLWTFWKALHWTYFRHKQKSIPLYCDQNAIQEILTT